MPAASTGLSIDWHLLVLQAVNFLILFGILTWLVWKPLIAAIDNRRRTITEGLAAAAAQKRAAEAAESERTALLAQAKQEAAELVAQTRDQLKNERISLAAELAAERQRLADQNKKQLKAQRAKLEDDMKASLRDMIVVAVGRVVEQVPDKGQLDQLVSQAVKEQQ